MGRIKYTDGCTIEPEEGEEWAVRDRFTVREKLSTEQAQQRVAQARGISEEDARRILVRARRSNWLREL